MDWVKAARIANKIKKLAGIAKHHPIPKFLGGLNKQILSRLPPHVHQEYHELLRLKLKELDIPLNIGGKGGSAQDWAVYFINNPKAQQAAFGAILDAARVIDLKYGTTITQDIWKSIMGKGFRPYP